MVDVNTQNKTISVNVSSSGVSSNINASGDTTLYYSNKAKEWATSNRIVDGVDYSSKYYAGKANQSALNAQSFAQSAQDSYNQVQDSVDSALSNIDSSVQGAIDEINNTKTDIITDIEFVAEGEKQEIEDLIDTGKDELKEAIGDVKVLATLEIGDIGIAPLCIDETKGKRRYLNGQVIIQEQYVEFTNKVKSAVALYPTLACTESEWQTTATMTEGGQVGKFVVDDDAGTIRLPKIIMPIQGLTNLSKLGEIVEAGLPNIEGKFISGANSTQPSEDVNSGAFYKDSITGDSLSGGSFARQGVTFDASLSNPIYGNSNTVQQEQIQYPYFIQVATGAETEDNIVNEIELNNPFSLLDYKFSEYELNNLSWLRSNGQYNSKAIYPAVYDLLLKIYNGVETKAGVSVKLTTETFTDYDFVLNTAEETFRLPVKVKLASGKAVAGNGLGLGLTDGTNNYGIGQSDSSGKQALYGRTGFYGNNAGATGFNTGIYPTLNVPLGITTDPTKSGIETSDNGLYLYFYVGETVQNANLINAGRIEEKLVDKVDTNASNFTADGKSLISGWGMPSSKFIDLTLGASGSTYTAPANGWYVLNKVSNGVGQYIVLAGFGISSQAISALSAQGLVCTLPVKKGDVCTVTYNTGGATQAFRFIYAQGEVS